MRGTSEALRASGALASLARASFAPSRLAVARSGAPSVFALDAGRAISTCPFWDASRAHSRCRFLQTTVDDRAPPRSPAPASSGARARVRSFHSGPSLGFAAAKLPTSAKKAKAEAKGAKEAKEAKDDDEKTSDEKTKTKTNDSYADDRERLFGAALARDSDLDAQNDARAMRAVNVAVQANTLIFFTKLGAYGMTGSSVMLAEAVHSAADILNQSLLFMGIRSSAKAPDENYNYGYRRERFVWSLISAVGVFFAGSGVSVAHGVHTLLNPTPVEHAFVGIGVLAASAAIDAYSLRVAYVALRENAEARDIEPRGVYTRGPRSDLRGGGGGGRRRGRGLRRRRRGAARRARHRRRRLRRLRVHRGGRFVRAHGDVLNKLEPSVTARPLAGRREDAPRD
jgi:hypothetical protein